MRPYTDHVLPGATMASSSSISKFKQSVDNFSNAESSTCSFFIPSSSRNQVNYLIPSISDFHSPMAVWQRILSIEECIRAAWLSRLNECLFQNLTMTVWALRRLIKDVIRHAGI